MKISLDKSKSVIPYAKQSVDDTDIKSVIKILKSDFLTQGSTVPEFENKIKSYCNSKNAVAFNSATNALHASCLALGVGQGDIVWTSAVTFVASANSALYCGAKVDFVDIEEKTNNLSIVQLKKKLIKAKKNSKLPKVLIPVHLSGLSCDMEEIHSLSKEYGFKIIEDASHAIGAKYKGNKVGSCKYSDIVIFSFHPVKIITTGEGGMALTNKTEIAKKLVLLRSHGITRDKSEMSSDNPNLWYYEQVLLGHNSRMSDIHAALGLSQMNKIDSFLSKRKLLAKRYNDSFLNLPITTPESETFIDSSIHLYIIKITKDNSPTLRDQLFKLLREKNILVNLHYIPVYLHPYYEKLGFKKGYCENAEKYYNECISLPMYPDLKTEDQKKVVSVIKNFLKC